MSASEQVCTRTKLSVEPDRVFGSLEKSATVDLICTPATELHKRDWDTPLSEVLSDPELEPFDYVPVRRNGTIVGLFDLLAAKRVDQGQPTVQVQSVGDLMQPLCEKNLISADAGILTFLASADEQPCRLLIKDTEIVGIVTTADFLKLPARPVFFLLVIHVELLMAEAIRREFDSSEDWFDVLTPDRQRGVEDRHASLKKQNLEPLDRLTATLFCEKREIVLHKGLIQLPCGKNKAQRELEKVEELRNLVAHPGDYAKSPSIAADLVMKVRLAQKWIVTMEQALKQETATR